MGLQDMDYCSDALETITVCLVLLLRAGLFLLFLTIFILHVTKTNALHPLFSVTYSIILLSYTLCNLAAFTYGLILVTLHHSIIFDIVGKWYYVAYAAISPQVAIALFERFYATINANSYETARPWMKFTVAQFIGWLLVALSTYINGLVSESYQTELVQITVSVTVILGLIGLTVKNCHLSASTLGKRNLQARYQFSENVRALRMLVLIAVCDTIGSLNDSIAEIFFNVTWYYSKKECSSEHYLFRFIGLKTISFIVEYSIPLSILFQYIVTKGKNAKPSRKQTVDGSKELDHFAMLELQWK